MNYRSVAQSTSTIFASAFVALATCASALAAAEGTCTLTIEQNKNFEDVVTVTSDQTAVSDGVYPVGTVITLTATPAADGTFKKWYGDVAKEDRTKQTITFTLTEDRWIFARFVHQWTLSSDKKTMTDGHFTVNVTNVNEKTYTLDVGTVNYIDYNAQPGATLLADGDTGSGVLDLGGTITLEGDDVPWTITKFAAGKGSQTVYTNHTGTVTTYISPGTVTIGNTSQLFHRGDNNKEHGVSYETIIIDEPELESFFTQYIFTKQGNCSRLICELPKVRAVSTNQREPFNGLPAANNTKFKFDWWDLSSLSSMTNIFFIHQWGRNYELYRRLPGSGTLTLPSMRGVDWVPGGGTQLFMMPNIECISLGGATDETTVTNLCTYAFAGNTKLKKLVLHAASDMRVGSRIFADHTWGETNGFNNVEVIGDVTYDIGKSKAEGRVPDVIHFTGQAISFVAISNLLDRVTSVDTAVKPVTILASKYQAGWGAGTRAEWISPATVEERAAYPGETVIGIYRENAAAPSGKAVVLHSANEWDEPSGLMMIFR